MMETEVSVYDFNA